MGCVGGERAGANLTGKVGKRERKALHPAVRKLCGGRGGAADEEGVKAMLRSIGRYEGVEYDLGVLESSCCVLCGEGGDTAVCELCRPWGARVCLLAKVAAV